MVEINGDLVTIKDWNGNDEINDNTITNINEKKICRNDDDDNFIDDNITAINGFIKGWNRN